jgi:predicted nuclease of restriction endonuclease-like RecB superfamily
VVLHYLGERDHPWLRVLIDEYERGVGSKRSELSARLREPLTTPAPRAKQRLAAEVLQRLTEARIVAAVPPREARWEVFREAAISKAPRSAVLAVVAAQLGIETASLEAALFADLLSECTASPLPAALSPERLAAEANLRLVNTWIQRARSLRILAWGNTRALVRQARLHGLICNVRRAPAPARIRQINPPRADGFDELPEELSEGVELEVSGPLALFRHTALYGRALCAVVPRVLWCHRFELHAACEASPGGSAATLVVRTGDPLRPGRELRAFDSRLEERFAKDFRKAAPDWDLVREPRPLSSDGSLIFPDFELVHRLDSARRFLLEIVGFWTPEYLEEKLRKLRVARLENVILCIDAARACANAVLPPNSMVLRYTRRIDVTAVLSLLRRA